MQFRTEIRQIVVVCALLFFKPVHLRELDGLVEGDFSLRSLQLETRIPCAAIWAVEAATERVRVAECGVDDPIVRYAEHKLVDADSRQPADTDGRPLAFLFILPRLQIR